MFNKINNKEYLYQIFSFLEPEEVVDLIKINPVSLSSCKKYIFYLLFQQSDYEYRNLS